ncbi:MAG TPA: hypothetical protein DGD08_15000 [Gemmatimonas aurantiaca]|uniref:Tetratricopeptide repeat protein n=2 Tax=Gemmatimonas aurantiaca TaxID=173480 RepID=A0A3D4VBL2_9BACT|nr:hypothetical protein [Gemmatimonas aurantiaca]BAH39479.1 hypothetical membrane protein [Gemmatimonas aurantiaca T-27]HCT58511.1 hypothetical protein [Gemmatimonas aurantiaca]
MLDLDLFEKSIQRERRRRFWSAVSVGVVVSAALVAPAIVVVMLYGAQGRSRLLLGLFIAPVAAGLLFAVLSTVTRLGGAVLHQFLHPSGGGEQQPPVVPVSQAEAMAAQGRLDDAIDIFESIRLEHGDSAATLRTEAELMTSSGHHDRARIALQRLRHVSDGSRSDELYATHRLVDLYLGPLEDSGRAVVELRRLADRFPGTPDAEGALAELQRRRALRAATSDMG